MIRGHGRGELIIWRKTRQIWTKNLRKKLSATKPMEAVFYNTGLSLVL